MQHTPIVNELILHQNADFAESRGIIPQLLFKLIAASVQHPNELRLPDIVNQPGWDGIVNSPISFEPFVPLGRSLWEIGTGNKPQSKATVDFKKRLANTTAIERSDSTYVFVTSRSASAAGWSITSQERWKKSRKKNGWKEIRIIDATQIQHWLSYFPEIDLWLAEKFMNISLAGYDSPSLYWKKLEKYGYPPSLKPKIFLEGREVVINELLKIFRRESLELRIETLFPEEAVDFVVAFLESLSPTEEASFAGRCLIVKNAETWGKMCTLDESYILIAEPSLDLGGTGAPLRNTASTYNKSVIYSTTPSSYTHGNTIKLPEMKAFQLFENLKTCGYKEERARQISEKCKGKITSLKRLLMDLNASPLWANSDKASELVIASLIGQWDAKNEGDIEGVEGILGKGYGEWLQVIRPLTLMPDPPLTQQNERWRFISRYEGWQNLGKFLSDNDLDRLLKWVLILFKERDPKFDLPYEQRWLSSYNNKAKYSDFLKMGLAETLALIGTFPNALISTTVNKAEYMVGYIIREVLKERDWKLWATLNNYFPLFAEADPEMFLDSLEDTIYNEKDVIENLFAQEGTGITGWNYMTGILWGLEALAWSEKYVIRVCIILSKLSLLDPGGNWANRPFNSLSTIFLPWMRQTCASSEKKLTALKTLANEFPEVTWHLIMKLLPHAQTVTSGNHKPIWREFIPEDFSQKVSTKKYWEEVNLYISLALDYSKKDFEKLSELIEHIDITMPPSSVKNIIEFLRTIDISIEDEKEIYKIWNEINKLVRKHKKFHDAHWALTEEIITEFEKINNSLKSSNPILLFKNLFDEDEFELMEDTKDFDSQRELIGEKRTSAIGLIYFKLGAESVIQFAKIVKYPAEVGSALGRNSDINLDNLLLPNFLLSEEKNLKELVRGYVWNKFSIYSFGWIDQLSCDDWNQEQNLELLGILPFIPETWEKAKNLLQSQEYMYWNFTDALPYQLKNDELLKAVELLKKFNRPRAAIKTLQWMLHSKIFPPVDLVYEILLTNIQNKEAYTPIDPYAIIELIKWLQHQKNIDEEVLSKIEWIYLSFLDSHSGAIPQTLQFKLASDPDFFCEVMRAIFRSENSISEEIIVDENKKKLAEQAYLLIQEWKIIPGSPKDKTIDREALTTWVKKVKQICSKSGHLTVALSNIGKVFANAPSDSNGLWIDKTVAEILNNPQHKIMREGFTTELFNKRGVFYGTSGEGEKKEAQAYNEKADLVEKEGFSRLSAVLRDLARTYLLDANREALSDPF